jgi:hypothetical protein
MARTSTRLRPSWRELISRLVASPATSRIFKDGGRVAEKTADVADGPQRSFGHHSERDDVRRMPMDDGRDIRPRGENLAVDEVNVLSGVRLSRHYLIGMRSRNWGRIVFISSESAVQIPAEMIHDEHGGARRSARTGRNDSWHEYNGEFNPVRSYCVGGYRELSRRARRPTKDQRQRSARGVLAHHAPILTLEALCET